MAAAMTGRISAIAVFFFILVFQVVSDMGRIKKKCSFERCQRPVYGDFTAKQACRRGLKYVACARRILKRCKVYRETFTKDDLQDLQRILKETRAELKSSGYCGDGYNLHPDALMTVGFGSLLFAIFTDWRT